MANESNKVISIDSYRSVSYEGDVPSNFVRGNKVKILEEVVPTSTSDTSHDTIELTEVTFNHTKNRVENKLAKEGSDMRKDEFDEKFDMHKELMEAKFDKRTADIENKVGNLEKSIGSLAADIEKKIEASFSSLESKIEANSSKLLLELHKAQTEEANKVRSERKSDRNFIITTGIAIASLAVAVLTIILT